MLYNYSGNWQVPKRMKTGYRMAKTTHESPRGTTYFPHHEVRITPLAPRGTIGFPETRIPMGGLFGLDTTTLLLVGIGGYFAWKHLRK